MFEKKILNINKNLHIVYSNYSPKNLNKFRNRKLLAFAGIGNPKNFFKLLEENNLMVEKKIVFPDHYQFTIEEFQNIILEAKKKKLKIIMTEKDFFKTKNFDTEKNYDTLTVIYSTGESNTYSGRFASTGVPSSQLTNIPDKLENVVSLEWVSNDNTTLSVVNKSVIK